MTSRDPLADLTAVEGSETVATGIGRDDSAIFASLLAEHDRERLGPLWLAEIRSACASTARRYDPVVYARSADWNEAALDDLAMDAVERLLSKNQIEYICDVTRDAGHARALLHRQVRFTLLERRDRTVVDNLLERAVDVLSGSDYVLDPSPPTGWRAAGEAAQALGHITGIDSKEARLLALRLRRLPRLQARGTERASPVWSLETLQVAVRDVVETLGKVTRDSLDRIFRDALTALALGELVVEEEGSRHLDPGIGPEEAVVAADVADRLMAELTERERGVLACKFHGVSDSDVAQELGVSRPTVDGAKKSASAKVRALLADVHEAVQDATLMQLQERLAAQRAERLR
jgi:DNA-directed RNA polymerase specialized sigma24 family protein